MARGNAKKGTIKRAPPRPGVEIYGDDDEYQRHRTDGDAGVRLLRATHCVALDQHFQNFVGAFINLQNTLVAVEFLDH